MRNKEKGITLIALIITIIVMLILVGVVVTVAIQSNLLGTAKIAGDKYKGAYEDESNMNEVTVNGEKYDSIDEYLYGRKISVVAKTGEYVNYKVDYDMDGTTADDWRVFGNDGNNVYLISSDYTEIQVDLSSYGTANAALEHLNDEEFWGEKYGNNFAKYVHGGPTREMFEQAKRDCNNENDGLLGKIIYSSGLDMNYGFWIASLRPDGHLCRVLSGDMPPDDVTSSDVTNLTGYLSAYSGRGVGIRPLICLKENVVIVSGKGTVDEPYEIELK